MDLANLTPTEIALLKQQLAQTDDSGRSPIKARQLHDLRLLPTKDDPRPMFVWSAESPRDAGDLTRTSEFPKLMWHQTTGEEITVYTMEQQIEKGSFYVLDPPDLRVDPIDKMRLELESLSPEDRALVVETQQKSRMAMLQAKLAALSEDDLHALLAGTVPAKRGPGRPKKDGSV